MWSLDLRNLPNRFYLWEFPVQAVDLCYKGSVGFSGRGWRHADPRQSFHLGRAG